MLIIRRFVRILPFVLLILLAIWAWEKFKSLKNPFGDTEPEVSHSVLLQKITSMGKLELVKYNFRDVVESRIKKNFLPDAKVLLIVTGEATGCLDLTKIRVADITEEDSVLVVHLPEPEICNYKIDHSKSRVYNTEYAFMDEAKLVDDAFKKAEVQVAQSAREMGILDQTKKSAEQILKPFLETVSKKKVILKYSMKDKKRELG
ncbi:MULTISPECIES: DUF4230 domain-containing protein [unclassified Arcicella]|uniref:DUF4230 domain-containing protein n=1 Tax=unclassified Arcicella TaxID=2644986 RepID=UPI00286099CB|nr:MULTISPECIES: DUF4230 domain-containing protein [unclassified Arcicella]MDR6561196.1 hypothetical protein [Arcicella sp. BE51]MDR6811080.1 hypothetical protein [Arcicella sp. BE140]MDR6822430.1 hypothetical protein [Arcicella sp. BE139]